MSIEHIILVHFHTGSVFRLCKERPIYRSANNTLYGFVVGGLMFPPLQDVLSLQPSPRPTWHFFLRRAKKVPKNALSGFVGTKKIPNFKWNFFYSLRDFAPTFYTVPRRTFPSGD